MLGSTDKELSIKSIRQCFLYQDFHLGGRKRLCARTHITSAEPNSLSAGVPLKGPGSSGVVVDAFSCYLSLIFKHSDTKLD